MDIKGRGVDIGAVIFGAIVLVVGVWFLLTETFGIELPALDWDLIWPLFIVALGVGILVRAMRRGSATEPR